MSACGIVFQNPESLNQHPLRCSGTCILPLGNTTERGPCGVAKRRASNSVWLGLESTGSNDLQSRRDEEISLWQTLSLDPDLVLRRDDQFPGSPFTRAGDR